MEQFNIQEYLDSGVIELYVLDQLNDAEREAVEKLAAQYPTILKEIVEVEAAMGEYHNQAGLTPPDYILANILAETANGSHPEPLSPESAVQQLPNRGWITYLPIAAAVIGLAMAGWMFLAKQAAQNKADKLQQELWALRSIEQDCAKNEQFLTKQLEILRQDGIQKILVKAGEQPIAAVYWNQSQKAAHLNFLKLSDPGKSKQYQLWAFVEGKSAPVSVGVVDWEALQKGLVSFNFDQKPVAFAISLERMGGAISPTDVKGASAVFESKG